MNDNPIERVGPPERKPYAGEHVVPGIPCQKGKRRSIPPELWVIIRAVAEGKSMAIDQLARLSGIDRETIKMRSHRDGWDTQAKKNKEVKRAIGDVVGDLLGEVAGYVEDNNVSEELPTRSHAGGAQALAEEVANGDYVVEEVDADVLLNAKNVTPSSGALRLYLETPTKDRPGVTDLLRPPMGVSSKLKKLQEMAKGMEGHLKQMARTHQLTVAEITQVAMVYMHDQVELDPALAIILAPHIEKIDKVARRNFKLDSGDILDGAKTVIMMSDPAFLPPIPEPDIMSEENQNE